MNKIAHFSFVTILNLLCILNVNAQDTLQGSVTDFRTGEPLIGANIAWENAPNIGTQTDLDGHFTMETKAEDSLVVSYIGYQPRVLAPRAEMSIRLRAAEMELGTVMVKAARLVASEFATEQLTKLDIYLNPNSKADVLLAVDVLPASTNTDESANISLRGSSAAETGILLNNVPLDDVVRFDQTNGIGQFSIFNTAMMESVNVFPSNPPLEFGNATSGVVALYTDDDLPIRSNSLSINLVGVSALLSRPFSQKTGWTAYANFNTHHGLKAFNKNALPDLNSFQTLDGGAYLIHKFNAQTTLKLFNFSLLENYNYQFQQASHTGAFEQHKQRSLTIVNLVRQGQRTRWEWNQSFNVSKADYGTGNLQITNQGFDYYTAVQGAYFQTNWTLKGGLSTKLNRNKNSGQFPTYYFAFAPEHPSMFYDTTTTTIVPEAFLYGKYRLQKEWTIGGGVRAIVGTQDIPSSLSMQANLNWQPLPEHRLTLATGQYHKVQAPSTQSETWNLLKSYQLAVDYQYVKAGWEVQVALYLKNNKDRFQANKIRGGEVFVAYQKNNFKGSVSVASIDSKIANSENMTYPSAQDLSYYLRAYAQYQFDAWTLGLLYKQRQGRYYEPVIGANLVEAVGAYEPLYSPINEGERLPDYHLLDLSISHLIPTSFGSMIVYASANNILNFKNIRGYQYNADYSEQVEELYGQRVVFFGGVLQWN